MIQIEEVGLREGLQSNDICLSLEDKIRLIDQLLDAGLDRVQLGSFVNEKRVPQMAGVDELFKHYADNNDVLFSGLVLNQRGLERALESKVKLLNISISASDEHNKENTGKSINEAMPTILDMIKTARGEGVMVRAGIQAAFGCHFKGMPNIEIITEISQAYKDAGADEIGLSDTSGFATPGMIKNICNKVYDATDSLRLGIHLHDTFGMGMANVLAAIHSNVTVIDSSVAGMGGCPFMPDAPGNLPTEDLLHMLHSLGYLKEIKLKEIIDAATTARALFGKDFTGIVSKNYSLFNKLGLLEGLIDNK